MADKGLSQTSGGKKEQPKTIADNLQCSSDSELERLKLPVHGILGMLQDEDRVVDAYGI